jgi:hypothetical protein
MVLLFALVMAGRARAGTVIDRIEVVVEDQIVLASEVRLEQELLFLDTDSSPFWSDPSRTSTERLTDAAIVRAAAAAVALYDPEDDAVRARLESLRAAFPHRSGWAALLQRHGLTEQRMLVVLRRRMIVERYLDRNNRAKRTDFDAWMEATNELIDSLRLRTRVRLVEHTE